MQNLKKLRKITLQIMVTVNDNTFSSFFFVTNLYKLFPILVIFSLLLLANNNKKEKKKKKPSLKKHMGKIYKPHFCGAALF